MRHLTTISFLNGIAQIRDYEVGHAAVSAAGEGTSPNASIETSPPVWRMIASRHLCGTEPLWCHFFNASSRTPRARAAVSTSVQSMQSIAPNGRDVLSLRQGTSWPDHPHGGRTNVVAMPRPLTKPPPSDFIGQMCARAKRMRIREKISGSKMAEYLGIPYDTYKTWEYRTPMPHVHIELFSALCKSSAHELFTGERLKVNGLDAEQLAALVRHHAKELIALEKLADQAAAKKTASKKIVPKKASAPPKTTSR